MRKFITRLNPLTRKWEYVIIGDDNIIRRGFQTKEQAQARAKLYLGKY